MSEIKSAVPDSTATLKLLKPPSGVVTTATITGRGVSVAIDVHTADLHAALGIDELGCGCDEADENLKAAIQRAEEAEAESLEQAKLVRMFADRAEKAEAIIERARELLPVTLRAALNSSPALPTWSGALIVVEGLPAEDGPVTLTLHDDGRWYYLTGTSYYPADRVARADWKLAHITTA